MISTASLARRRARSLLSCAVLAAASFGLADTSSAEDAAKRPLCLMSVSVETHFVVMVDPAAKGTPATIAMALAKNPAAAPGDLVTIEQEDGQSALKVVEPASVKCKPLLEKPHH